MVDNGMLFSLFKQRRIYLKGTGELTESMGDLIYALTSMCGGALLSADFCILALLVP
jgi:hypothetical protein